MKRTRIVLFLIALPVAFAGRLSACPNCYGGSDNSAAAGMNWAILAMLGITGSVMALILAAAFFFWRRAKRQRAEVSDRLFVNEEGQLYITNVKGVPEWNNF